MTIKSIAIILYSNIDYYPSTTDAVRLLENKYKIVIFSRNIEDQLELFGKNTVLYKFGRHTSVIKSERKPGLSKLIEYVLFTLKTIYYSRRHKSRCIIAYDTFSLTTAVMLRLFNPQIKIFYHAHEIIEPGSSKWYHLRYWTEKVTIAYAKDCVWVSQPDVKRADFFKNLTGIKDVKVMRNFALRNFKEPVEKLALCEKLKQDGYVVGTFIGTIGKESYIENLVQFIRTSEMKIAFVIAGVVREKSIENLLRNENNRRLSRLVYLGFIPKKEINALLNSADFALALYAPSLMTEMNAGSSAKVGAYITFGLPVIYPSFWDYEPYYKEIGLNYDDGEGLLARVREMAKDQDLRRRLGENAKRKFKENINFESEFRELKETLDGYMKLN